MKYFICCFLGLLCSISSAQHSISGTVSPAEDFSWLIAYRLKPGSQVYVKDTKVENGAFTLALPADAKAGTYRIVYAVPQEDFYFDIIYSGKEDVTLAFKESTGAVFTESKENILFQSYFSEVNTLEQELVNLYKTQNTKTKKYTELTKALTATQERYLEKSKGLFCHSFIAANNPFAPKEYVPLDAYVDQRKQQYFKALDFSNEHLQSSTFLTEKVVNYVMTALPLEVLSAEDTEMVMEQNVNTVATHTKEVDKNFQTHLFYNLWGQTSASGFNATADYIYNNFLKNLATTTGSSEITTAIEEYNRTRLGAIPPDIEWKEGNATHKLSTTDGAAQYVLVFWSSTCGHCLKELPKLHDGIKANTTIKVIAVGLEEDTANWDIETKKLGRFTHTIALGKWDSSYAEAYNIQQTPSYFVLDKDKKIVAKPEDYMEVLEFLEKGQ